MSNSSIYSRMSVGITANDLKICHVCVRHSGENGANVVLSVRASPLIEVHNLKLKQMSNKLQLELMDLGFLPNSKQINRFRPHYIKGKDLLFLIKKDYFISKIVNISQAFIDYEGNVYGVLLDEAPNLAGQDWVTVEKLILLQVNPIKKGQWSKDGNSIEYVPYVLSQPDR